MLITVIKSEHYFLLVKVYNLNLLDSLREIHNFISANKVCKELMVVNKTAPILKTFCISPD